MDFGALLSVAKKNSQNNQKEVKYYSTKFAPPKKETKDSKRLSDNIQKFLQKREAEEEQRKREKQRELQNLLALRDDKSKNKIKKMLKVTKSANKSVLEDAVNSEHTAVTMQGPDQPDADDYGYVSHEANAFYQKYIDKVKDVKEDKSYQSTSRPQSLKDLSGTKERVKEAITREAEEKKSHTRQRNTASHATSSKQDSSSSSVYGTSKTLYDPEAERREEERKKREEEKKKIKSRKPLPPPMDFQALLKLAEKKQHEPIEITVEVKKKEPERLLTSKEKRELEERKRETEERKRARERMEKNRNNDVNKERKDIPKPRMEPNGRIPKLNQTNNHANTSSSHTAAKSAASSNVTNKIATQPKVNKPSAIANSTTAKSSSLGNSKSSSASSSKQPLNSIKNTTSTSTLPHNGKINSKDSHIQNTTVNKKPYNGATREFPPRDISSMKSRQFPPSDVQKTRQFPPADVHRNGINKSKSQAPKRRIIDDDDDYDSEMDDFIDDGDCEEDYSSQIRAIFGYDKSKYRDLDDEDDTAMESNFAQVQREEYISKKIGMQEDLEDMRQEAIHKKRKDMMKKRRL